MHLTALPLAALTLLNSAAVPAPAPHPSEPQATMREFKPDAPLGKQCRDNVSPTNDEAARQPRFERRPATPDEGQMIYAVERPIDGCSVVVVKYDGANAAELQRRFGDMTHQQSPDSGK